MHRIDTDGAVGARFSPGDPALGLPSTVIGTDWLNAVQEEIANAIEASGIVLAKADNTQLAAVLAALVAEDRVACPIANVNFSGEVFASRRGKLVTVVGRGGAAGNPVAANAAIATVPEGYRPALGNYPSDLVPVVTSETDEWTSGDTGRVYIDYFTGVIKWGGPGVLSNSPGDKIFFSMAYTTD